MKFDGYHTALAEPLFEGPPASHWTDGSNVALVGDIMTGLPSELASAHVIYGEPPWRQGYEVFNRRAGHHDARTWGEWLVCYDEIMRYSGKPACAMVGKQGLSYLNPDDAIPTRVVVHNCAAFLALWNDVEIEADNTDEAAADLARRYGIVADVWCGFGRASRIVKQNGGSFRAMDVNPLCIGYIAATAGSW